MAVTRRPRNYQDYRHDQQQPPTGVMVARRRNYKGIATFAILPTFAVFLFAMNQLSNWGSASMQPTPQNEVAQAANETNEPAPTLTPDWTIATVDAIRVEAAEIERQVGRAKLTQVAAEYELHRELVAQQYRDSVAAATAQYIPTQTAIAQAQANDAAQFAIEINKSQRIADAEYWQAMTTGTFLPLFCVGSLAIVGLFVVASLFPAVQKIAMSAADEAMRRDAQETEARPATLQPVVEVHSAGNIARNKLDGVVLSVLPVFAQVARELDENDINPLTDQEWAGEEKRGITKPQWYAFRNWLLSHEFAQWKNEFAHAQGAELTGNGWALVNRVNDVGVPSPSDLGMDI